MVSLTQTMPTQAIPIAQELQLKTFFQQSEGAWYSQRRYYTLQKGETQEVESHITVRFLEQGCEALRQLARLHDLQDELALTCGVYTAWESNYLVPKSDRPTKGSTVFGALGTHIYRDRGFATTKPIIADYWMRDESTLCLRTTYNGNVFEEEVRLIGSRYRTRQSIISRAGEEQMIGQYLEVRQTDMP